jgi:hypothetical protein
MANIKTIFKGKYLKILAIMPGTQMDVHSITDQ